MTLTDTIMTTLQTYAAHKDGTYVSMALTETSRQMLDRYVQQMLQLQERVDPTTYHITIIYSRTPVPSAEQYRGETTNLAATIVGYEVFPTKSQGRCLVMRLHYPYATQLNAQLTRQGATSDYNEYKPHITLAYDTQQELDPTTLPVPQFALYFEPVQVAPLQPDYVPKNA